MFDDLRDLSNTQQFEEDQNQDDGLFKDLDLEENETFEEAPARRKRSGTFLGMTAPQRFLIAVMLMFTVLLLGMLAMFVTGSMAIF